MKVFSFRGQYEYEMLEDYIKYLDFYHKQLQYLLLIDDVEFKGLLQDSQLPLLAFIKSLLYYHQTDPPHPVTDEDREDTWMLDYCKEMLQESGKLLVKLVLRLAHRVGPAGLVECGLGKPAWLVRLALLAASSDETIKTRLMNDIYDPIESLQPYRSAIRRLNKCDGVLGEAKAALDWILKVADGKDQGSLFEGDDPVGAEDKMKAIRDRVMASLIIDDEEGDDEDVVVDEKSAVPTERFLVAAYIQDGGLLFERSSKARQSQARNDLCKRLGWSHEQVEGWAIMFRRNPKKDSIISAYKLENRMV